MPSDGRRSILLFDRDMETRRALGSVLADAGFAVNTYALDELPIDDGADLVITGLPGQRYERRQALGWVRRVRTRYRAPVVVISGYRGVLDDTRLARLAAALLVMPVEVGELTDRVRSVFGSVPARLDQQVDAERDEEHRDEHRLEPTG